ncbi:AI-2E family transporter [Nigerium massiliense]|uniref:AI-2E family transporter n=1 Tax=Nigerium massiliense TaxID=1522317 RepID=UPI000693AE77|nr:AI-2E family transporter [Nigerium massiliense]
MESTPEGRTSGTPQILIVLLVIAAAVVGLAGLNTISEIVGPLFLTVNLFIAAWPVRTALLKRGAPRLVGALALFLVVFLILAIFFFALGWGVSALVTELPAYQSRYLELYRESVALLASFGITEQQLVSQLQQISPANFTGLAQSALSQVSNLVSLVTVIIVMMFMMVIDSGTFHSREVSLQKFQPRVSVALTDFVLGVRRYWIVTSIFGLIVAVLDVAVLLFMNIPLAFVWGIVSFLTNYIPNVGFIIGIIPPVLMALLTQGPTAALIVIIAYSVINFVLQSIIQPKFNGDAVGVTATVSFLSLLLWSTVLGPMGALLGLPATLLVKNLLVDHDPDTRWLNAFIASKPETTNPSEAGQPQVLDADPDDPTPKGGRGSHRALPAGD